jgi:hypothetical protein
MAYQGDKRAEGILAAFDRRKSGRSNWEAYWDDVAQHVLTRYSGDFYTRNQVKGAKRDDKILDITGVKGLDRFSAAVESMVTPRGQRWHRLRASNPDLMRPLRVQKFFGRLEDILYYYRYSARANFASQVNETWVGLGAFGTAPMFIDEPTEKTERGLRYRAEHLGRIFIEENHVGIINKAYRQIFMTADQAVQRFGKENLPEEILKEYDKVEKAKDPNKEFEIIHCIRPRTEEDPKGLGEEEMPFASIYVSREGQKTIRTGGYFTFPMPTARYLTAPGEVYGRSVAMMALGSIKTLYEQKRTALKMGHRAVDPVLLAHDDGIIDTFDLRPGAINYGGITADGRPLVAPLDRGINFQPAVELMELERKDIDDAFLVSLFRMAVDAPQMTATEVIERTREKGTLLAPTMGRLQSEFLGPTIERELDLLARQGLLPEMPPELVEAQGEFEIEYDSPLSKAMRAEEAGGALRYIEIAGMYAQLTGDVSMLDHIDPDEAGPDLAWILNVPAKWRASEEKIAAKREQRAQQATAQTAIEAAPAAAGLMKVLGPQGKK